MSTTPPTNLHEIHDASSRLIGRIGLFGLFLVCSLAIFLFGPNYYPLFPTNGNGIYAAIVSAVFLAASFVLKRSSKLAQYGQIAYAFFIVSVVNLVSVLFAGYNSVILQYFHIWTGENQWIALGKVYDTLLVIIPILVLTKLSGADLGSLLLKRGNQNAHWGLGVGALVLVNFFTSALIFYGTSYKIAELGAVILWGAVFSFSNSLLEELWIRGIFIKQLVPLIGGVGTILLTSTWFAVLHFLGVAYLPASVVPIFVVNTFTLGLACSISMLKTDSIWGAFLIHAAADLFLFIATLGVH